MGGYVMIIYVMLFDVMLGPWFEDFEPILKVQPLLEKTSWHWWNWHLVMGIYWSLVDCLHKGMSNFNIFFVVSLNMMLSKQSTRLNGLRTEMPGSSSYITVKPPNTSTKWFLYLRATVKSTQIANTICYIYIPQSTFFIKHEASVTLYDRCPVSFPHWRAAKNIKQNHCYAPSVKKQIILI